MIVEQIYTSCLSQGSYYIKSNDEVAIIDPLREIDSYLERANKRGSKIKYIFETRRVETLIMTSLEKFILITMSLLTK